MPAAAACASASPPAAADAAAPDETHSGCSKFLVWDFANDCKEVYSFSVFFRETCAEPIFTCGYLKDLNVDLGCRTLL